MDFFNKNEEFLEYFFVISLKNIKFAQHIHYKFLQNQ